MMEAFARIHGNRDIYSLYGMNHPQRDRNAVENWSFFQPSCSLRTECMSNCQPYHEIKVFFIPKKEDGPNQDQLFGVIYQYPPWL